MHNPYYICVNSISNCVHKRARYGGGATWTWLVAVCTYSIAISSKHAIMVVGSVCVNHQQRVERHTIIFFYSIVAMIVTDTYAGWRIHYIWKVEDMI